MCRCVCVGGVCVCVGVINFNLTLGTSCRQGSCHVSRHIPAFTMLLSTATNVKRPILSTSDVSVI